MPFAVGGRSLILIVVAGTASGCLEETPGYDEVGASGPATTVDSTGVPTIASTTGSGAATDSTTMTATPSVNTTTESGSPTATSAPTTTGAPSVTTTTATGPTSSGPCPIDAFGGHRYLFCDMDMIWEDAQAFCEGQGWNLATIDDAAENDWLSTTAATYTDTHWWFGYNDRMMEGIFEWVDGTPAGYEKWEASEPNDSGSGEDCTELNRFPMGEWNDQGCAIEQDFICESG